MTRAPEDEVRRQAESGSADGPPMATRPDRRRARPTSPQRTPTSLEEILRELTGQSAEAEVEEEDDYELPPYLQEKKEEIGAPPPPELVEKMPKKLADKISLEDEVRRIKPIKVKTSVKRKGRSLGTSVAQSLRNPGGAKRAVILSEILQRKHF